MHSSRTYRPGTGHGHKDKDKEMSHYIMYVCMYEVRTRKE